MNWFDDMGPDRPTGLPLMVCGLSRTGTTLMTTILDSHPDVSMAYEIMPVGIPAPAEAASMLRQALVDAKEPTTKQVAKVLNELGQKQLGGFAKRSERALIDTEGLATLLDAEAATGTDDPVSIEFRSNMASRVAIAKAQIEGASNWGFKLNAPSVGAFEKLLPKHTRFVYMLRDPRDVYASHVERGFNKTLEQVCSGWLSYLYNFEMLMENFPERAAMIRYEDLVTNGEASVRALCEKIGLDFHQDMSNFFAGNASIHDFNHANSDELRQDFFDTSISRWSRDLSAEDVEEINEQCGQAMVRYGYKTGAAPETATMSISTLVKKKEQLRLSRAKKFHIDSYAQVLDMVLDENDDVLLLREACNPVGDVSDKRVAIIRHDIDHDIDTAVNIAKWENERGIRSTFCVLHSAWYYGALTKDGYLRDKDMVPKLREIQDLGHEINLHNNLVAVGLRDGHDPATLLRSELDFMRGAGIQIDGTSGHGDALCRELDFTNLEIFAGRAWDSSGGDRAVTHNGQTVHMGSLDMADFGLSYEAYDLPRDVYVTDSGGRPRLILSTRGMNGYRRKQREELVPYAHIKGVLTHPIWWGFDKKSGMESFPDMDQLMADREAKREERRAAARAAQS